MKRVLALIVSLATLLCLAACGGGNSGSGSNSGSGDTNKVYNLTFSMHTPADTPVGRHFQAMFDEIEEKTDGHVKITLHGSGTLAAAADVVDMVADGGCDMGWVFTSFYYGQFPLTDVLTLMGNNPQSCVQGTEVLYNLYHEFDEVAAEWSNFKVLQMHVNPVNYIYTSANPATLADVAKMSVRAPSGACASVMGNLGLNVISMAPNDIYDNLSKGNIQGYIIENTAVTDYSLNEVTKYVVNVPLNQGPFAVIMNKNTYNSLPAEYQAVIDEYTTLDACKAVAQVWEDQAAESGDKLMENAQLVDWSAEDVAAFNAASDAYDEAWVAEHSSDSFDAQKLLDRCHELYAEIG